MHALLLRRGVGASSARRLASQLSRRGCATKTSPVDRFALLSVDRRFDLDGKQLHQTYKTLMTEVHPDRHSMSTKEEQQAAADRASNLTDAYTVLRSPHTRATHLLELLGMPLTEETHSDVLGPGFLMHVMEVREELEEAGTEVARLQALREANSATVDELLAELGDAFAKPQGLEDAHTLTARLQYLQRIEDEIHERMPVS